MPFFGGLINLFLWEVTAVGGKRDRTTASNIFRDRSGTPQQKQKIRWLWWLCANVCNFTHYQSIALILQSIQVSKTNLLQQVTMKCYLCEFFDLSIESLARYHRSWATKESGNVHQPKRKQRKRDGVVDLPGSLSTPVMLGLVIALTIRSMTTFGW